jgi:copper(I)-binding protein
MRLHLPPLRRLAALAAVAVLLTMAGCSSSEPAPSSSTGAAALSVTAPWVKAADSGMTAAFGTLVNASDADVRIVSAASDVSPMELHEMATGADGQMVMRPMEGGFVVPAHGEHELGPGGDHVMFMDLTAPIEPGDDVTITLTCDDGSTFTFTAAARSYSGADETYEGDGDGDGMDGMDMTPSQEPTP